MTPVAKSLGRPPYLADIPAHGLTGVELKNRQISIPIDRSVLGFGNIIPNVDEVQNVRTSLGRLNVKFDVVELRGGGAIFIISEAEVSKLPKDAKGHYLPATKDSGHNLIPIQRSLLDSQYLTGQVADHAIDICSALSSANVLVMEAPQSATGVIFRLEEIARSTFETDLVTIEANGVNVIGEEPDTTRIADSEYKPGILERSLTEGKIVLIDNANQLTNFDLSIVQQYLTAMQIGETSINLKDGLAVRQISISPKSKLVLRYREIEDISPISVDPNNQSHWSSVVAQAGIPKDSEKRLLETIGKVPTVTLISEGPVDTYRLNYAIFIASKEAVPVIFQLASNGEFHVALPKEDHYKVAERALGLDRDQVDKLLAVKIIRN